MRIVFVIAAVLAVLSTGAALAVESNKVLPSRMHNGSNDVRDGFEKNVDSGFNRVLPDTAYFGGDDGTGKPILGGVWDWDTIVSDPLQGWTSVDLTKDWQVFFGRVTADDYTAHGDGCTPMINGTIGQLWVGMHEDYANDHDYIGGMGYKEDMAQCALSPEYAIDQATEEININFTYFADIELDFDYTYIYVRCFDSGGEELTESRYEVDYITGIVGTYTSPAVYDATVGAGLLDSATESVKVELHFWSDGGYSDEDGNWLTECGPFAADDITIQIGSASPNFFDFDTDAQGWTFEVLEEPQTYMGIATASDYTQWIEDTGLGCVCTLENNVLEFIDEDGSPFDPPGHPVGQTEEGLSSKIARGGFTGADYNTVLMEWDVFTYMPQDRGVYYRPGYKYYPHTTEVNPTPHWSPRMGQDTWFFTGDVAQCGFNRTNLTTLNGNGGDPMPATWDSMIVVYEVIADSESFGDIPGPDEGNSLGTPLVDNMRIGITGSADAPAIASGNGHQYHDGFGMNYPTYLEPSDVGNANATFDLSMPNDPDENDWHADSIVVSGPIVSSGDPLTSWNCDLVFQITHVGPRQHSNPDYLAWKSRFAADPEEGFVAVLMDSLEVIQGTSANKFVTYFHEDDPGYDSSAGDLSEANEILPDGIFTPGTRITYHFESYWTHVPNADHFLYPNGWWEFEILPRMRLVEDDSYSVQWPCALYIDAFNIGGEFFLMPTFMQEGIEFDKYDYLDTSSNWKCPMMRSYCPGGPYNPGGYGNNGCTVEQLLGYRFIFLNTGFQPIGSMEHSDWTLFSQWLGSTMCEIPTIRRGMVFDGDGISSIMNHHEPEGADLLHHVLGTTLVADSYREYNGNDMEFCVYLEPSADYAFDESVSDVSVYGNGCPNQFNYDVLGVQPGVSGAVGNMVYANPSVPEVEYSQVVRENLAYPANWKSVVNGFSSHHLSWVGCSGEECQADSTCIVNGAANMLMPALDWILDGGADSFDPWLYPCTNTGAEEEEVGHTDLAINFLRGASPNPFRNSATIRFSLAEAGKVEFSIYDVSGRLVKDMGNDEFAAGDNAILWDGTNNSGQRVDGGIFWMQMNTADGFSSGKKMLVLR